MKIIHLIHGHIDRNTRARIKDVLYNLSKEQANHGLDVEVWAIGFKKETIAFGELNIKYFAPLKKGMFLSADIKNEINAVTDSTVFHLHGGFHIDFYAISKLLFDKGKQYFVTPYNQYSFAVVSQGFFKRKVYFDFFEKSIIEKSSLLFCATEMEKDEVLQLLPSARIVVLPNGLTSVEEKSEVSRSSEVVFCYKGDLTEHSFGLDLLLLGFMKYKQWLKGKGKLRFIGQGFFENQIRALAAEHGLEDFIELCTTEDDFEKIELLTSSDAFYMTSRIGGVPEDLLLAASFGVPCVISSSCNIKDDVQEYRSGIVLAKNSIDQIALSMKKIEHLKDTNSSELLRYQVNSKNMIEQVYNWSVISMRLLNSYEAVVA